MNMPQEPSGRKDEFSELIEIPREVEKINKMEFHPWTATESFDEKNY